MVLVLHALFALALWYEMRLQPPHLAVAHDDIDQVLTVRLIDHSSKPRAAPPLEAPALPEPALSRQAAPPRARPATHEKSTRDAMVVQEHAATPAPATSATTLAAAAFSVRLPPTTETYASTSAKAQPAKPADDRRIMQHDSNRMQYKATRFEKYFPPPNETAGGALGRHIGDAIKAIAKSACDPTKKSTATNLLCSAPPLPPSPKDRDERLNLPPPPLADDPHPPELPPLSSCIAEYQADKPLSDGCPVNTPELAFKAEMRECIDLFRAGKRLKTWCPLDTPKRAAAESSAPAASSSVSLH
ncbi:hypothetical protein B0E46_16515 [Rhodanobacter sp. B04]|nr:hypothetical protein B0E46_16515 [Rhodanobacter sp. B04]